MDQQEQGSFTAAGLFIVWARDDAEDHGLAEICHVRLLAVC